MSEQLVNFIARHCSGDVVLDQASYDSICWTLLQRGRVMSEVTDLPYTGRSGLMTYGVYLHSRVCEKTELF